ncbi:MAG: sugar phosphate nucleotidyltransferase [Pseudomonadota bacterium]|nr:sugar phosphate nucleotidyltransferase [Pseudomonadota bacterium]
MKNWKSALLTENTSIYDAIKNLEYTGLQIILILNDRKQFIGTLTDGDIRSGILKGQSLSSSVKNLVNRRPKIAKPNWSYEKALQLMNKFTINHIPIINKKKITGVFTRNSNLTNQKKDNIILVMAGGRGKRNMPFTKSIPKPLLKYKNKMLIDIILNKIKKEGFENVFISIRYLKDKIIKKLNKNKKDDLKLNYLVENKPLGTVGCLSKLKNKTSKPILITNCDIVTDLKYKKLINFHVKEKSDLTVVIKEYKTQNPFGRIKIKNRKIIEIVEKPINMSYINAGIYVINASILKYVPNNKYYDMNELILKLMKLKKKIVPYPIVDKWSDVSQYLKK